MIADEMGQSISLGTVANAAKEIAKLLKQKADEKEFENTLEPYVAGLAAGRSANRGGILSLPNVSDNRRTRIQEGYNEGRAAIFDAINTL